jgi:hypothetical protein
MGLSLLATLISLTEEDHDKPQLWDKNTFLNFSRAFAFLRSPLKDCWMCYEKPVASHLPVWSSLTFLTTTGTPGDSPTIPWCTQEMLITPVHWFPWWGFYRIITQKYHLGVFHLAHYCVPYVNQIYDPAWWPLPIMMGIDSLLNEDPGSGWCCVNFKVLSGLWWGLSPVDCSGSTYNVTIQWRPMLTGTHPEPYALKHQILLSAITVPPLGHI